MCFVLKSTFFTEVQQVAPVLVNSVALILELSSSFSETFMHTTPSTMLSFLKELSMLCLALSSQTISIAGL